MNTKLFFVFLLLSIGIQAQILNIPDANFKAKLLSSSPSNSVAKNLTGSYFAIDADNNGEIQASEANQVASLELIDLSGNNIIQNYEGILSFTNVKSIKVDHYSSPNNPLNLSNLNFLEDINISFQGSSLNSSNLSVTDCINLKNIKTKGIILQNLTNTPALKNVDLFIYQDNNSLDILNNLPNFANLEKVTLTAYSGYNSSGISAGILNLSNHQYLKEVNINYLRLSALNLSHCSLLDSVNIHMESTLPNMNPNYFGTLDISYCSSITNLNIVGDSNLSGLITNNCQNLQTIKCSSKYLGNLNTNNCPILHSIELYGNSLLEMNNCPNLKNIKITKYNGTSFNATPAENLENLELGYDDYYSGGTVNFFGDLQNLTINNNLKLKSLNINNHIFTQFNCIGLPQLKNVSITVNNINPNAWNQPDFTTQFLQSVNIQNCPLLTSLNFAGQKGLKNITIKNCASLTSLEHSTSTMAYPEVGELKTVDIQDCAALSSLNLSYNKIDDFKLKNTGANTIDLSKNELSNFELVNNNNLTEILASKNKFTTLNLSTLPTNLQTLDKSFNLLTTITGTSSSIKNLNISNNNLTDFNIHNLPNLDSLIVGRNKIVDVDFSGHTKIRTIYEFDYSNYFGNPSFTNPSTFTKTFNVNNCTNLQTLLLESSSLEKVFAKNGVNENIYFQMTGNYPNLQYICCDASQITDLTAWLAMDGIVCSINDYCNFAPGGNHNTITGTVRFDDNNNGCDTNDEAFEHMKLKINNGTTVSETFVKNNGQYNLYSSLPGTYTVTAEPENTSLFTVTPSSFTTTFANTNNNISTQDICVTKNGNINDLEVVFAPVTNARPGFDAVYKLIWRNKGNTTMSGNVAVTFDNSKMIFMSSVLSSVVTGNQVTFNFTNLKPYQNTSSEITFKINAPTNPSNPVNINDILQFSANITPISADLNPGDNQFSYAQTTVGSYDPNDITCLEGNEIPFNMIGKYLHYIVNFENTGTAAATNIVVEMNINPDDFDISSLQLQNTSHSSYTKITGNKVEFMMKEINLAASAHGNIILKMKSKNNLTAGESVSNQANIYFDYNYPVETNEAITTINNFILQTQNPLQSKSSANIYPNPTKGDLTIDSESKILSVEVHDAQGRLIQKHTGINSKSAKITIKSNAQGVYLFKVNTEKETFVKKVIKN